MTRYQKLCREIHNKGKENILCILIESSTFFFVFQQLEVVVNVVWQLKMVIKYSNLTLHIFAVNVNFFFCWLVV